MLVFAVKSDTRVSRLMFFQMNACFSISAAKAGLEDGKYDLIGGSCITDPEGHVVAEAKGKGDEIVFADIDLEDCRQGKEKVS